MKCQCSQIDGNASLSSSLACCLAFIVSPLVSRLDGFLDAPRASRRAGSNCAANAVSDPVIDVLHANDIVLAEIGAGLDLDEIERDFSRIFETVHAAQRNKNRLVLAQQNFLVIARHNCGSVDDHPMLGAMEVLLQRQLRTWIDGDALDLKAFAGMDRLVITPWPMHAVCL